MIRCYLNGDLVEQPEGMDGLRLEKIRNRRYMGWLYRKLGSFPAGQLRFVQARAVALLRSSLTSQGVQAETEFKLTTDAGLELYRGYIDYSQYRYDGFGVSVALRDDSTVSQFEAQAATVFSVEPYIYCTLHGRKLADSVTLLVSSTATATVKDAGILNHVVPLLADPTSDINAVPGAVLPSPELTYQNTSDRKRFIRLSGQLVITATANTTTVFALKVGGVTLGRYTVNGTPTALACVVDLSLELERDDSFAVEFVPETNITAYSFTYQSGSTLDISEPMGYPATHALGLIPYQFFRQLIETASGGKLSLAMTDFFRKDGSNIWLSNGASIRNTPRPLKTSVQQLFENLSALHCLALTVEGETVVIDTLDSYLASLSTFQLSNILSYSERPDTSRLYSSIQIGYTTWQGTSKLSEREVNSSRSLTTANTLLRNELNLQSSLIASGTILEEVRRIQFEPDQAGSTKSSSYDENLFVVATISKSSGKTAERLERVQTVSGIPDESSSYNLRYTPMRNLSRWAWRLPGNVPLTMQDAGLQTARIRYDGVTVDETQPIVLPVGPIPMIGTVTARISMSDYAELTGYIELPTGQRGLVLSASWQQDEPGETATIEFELL